MNNKIPHLIKSEPHRKAIEKVIADLKKRGDLLGIILYGSLVEREPRPDSDIDMLAIVSSPGWSLKSFEIDGIGVELFIFDIIKILYEVCGTPGHYLVRNIGAGKIYYYSDPVILEIKKIGEKLYRKGPSKLDELSRFFIRLMYQNALSEVKRKCKDSTETLYLLNWIFYMAIVNYHQLGGIWLPKWTYLFKDLEEKDKFLSEKAKVYLKEKDLDKKYELVKEIVAHVLEPVGGFPGKEWEIEWWGSKIKAKKK
ncbi:nucleotidyltransferase domain-containing protein [bacterium]|nr:nucleotidyltransferase domain-containing protein [bacterium]